MHLRFLIPKPLDEKEEKSVLKQQNQENNNTLNIVTIKRRNNASGESYHLHDTSIA